MARPNFFFCIVFAILIILGGVPIASAHYSPELGRWLERDPIGYVDGMSLYEYVRSVPTTGLDPMGLVDIFGPGGTSLGSITCWPWTDEECCDAARTRGQDGGDLGGVICCDGRKVSCVWGIDSPDGRHNN